MEQHLTLMDQNDTKLAQKFGIHFGWEPFFGGTKVNIALRKRWRTMLPELKNQLPIPVYI